MIIFRDKFAPVNFFIFKNFISRKIWDKIYPNPPTPLTSVTLFTEKVKLHILYEHVNIVEENYLMDLYELDTYLQKLTPHQTKIIQIMYDAENEWLTRAKIAKRLGKRRLTPYDINCLTMLSEKEILNTSTQPTTAPGSDFAYIYTMPDEVANTIQKWSEMREEMEHKSPKKSRKSINLFDNNP